MSVWLAAEAGGGSGCVGVVEISVDKIQETCSSGNLIRGWYRLSPGDSAPDSE